MRIFIAGGGLTAEYIASRLAFEGHSLVVIEQDANRCRELGDALDALIIQGDASMIETWQRAGLEGADMLIALTGDPVNLMVSLIGQALAPQAVKVMRLRTPEHHAWTQVLKANGVDIDRVVHPEADVVARIFRVLRLPGVSDIRDFVGGRVKVFGMNIESGSPLAGQAVAALSRDILREIAQISLIFRDQELIFPSRDTRVREGDHLYVTTTADQLSTVLALMGLEHRETVRQVFIVGGTVGCEVAMALEQAGIEVKLFERDPEICATLAARLGNTLVINADGTNQQTLLRENIEGVDAFLALTGDDDANLIAALLARRLGAKKLVAMVNRIDYLPLAHRLGINTTVSLRVKTADAILEYARKGGVYSVRTFQEEGAEAIELVAPRQAAYLGRPLRDLHLPPWVVVGAVVRPDGEALVPGGDAVIEAGDRVVFFSSEQGVHRLELDFLATGDDS